MVCQFMRISYSVISIAMLADQRGALVGRSLSGLLLCYGQRWKTTDIQKGVESRGNLNVLYVDLPENTRL